MDFQQLNAQCIREPNYSQSPFHTARRIPHNTWKSVLDAVDGYHSVELDEESSRLTTFITPWGRFRYLRFPQGHCSAGDAFNGRVEEILSRTPRLVRIVDDLCIFDNSIEKHFWHTWELMETCAINGIVLNESKWQFCQKEIEFAGLTVTNDGVQPSKCTLSAISNFPPPTNLTSARSFFGLVNQVQWAYANGKEMAPFRALVKPNATYSWNDELKQLFENCKARIINQVHKGVKQYDINRMTCLQTDFSRQGLGYLLLQKYCSCSLEKAPICCKNGWGLVFAGSRFTQGAEAAYSPTEGELLAVAWALNHAHIFTKGCKSLIVSTDHKPLLGILNEKPLEAMKNPRLIRLKEKTLGFNFVVQFNQGKWHRGPDAMSRNPQINFCNMLEQFAEEDDVEYPDDMVDVVLAITEAGDDINVSIDDIRNATANDPTMEKLLSAISRGFPATQHLTDPSIRPYFNIREHLWVQQNIVMFKNRLVIPKSLRTKLLSILHSAHQGVEGMKTRASNSIYWPGLNESIRRTRLQCEACNRIAPSQPREPLQLIAPAEYPFQHICMDAFQISDHHYLAIVDRYSGWLIVFHVKGSHPQSKHIVNGLRAVFTDYGVPEKIFTDGGLPFQGEEVRSFLNIWKVIHKTSSARYPQGNGRAELGVKTAKRLLQENTRPDGSLNSNGVSRALLQYRNTPLQCLGLSPAQILYHRNLRDGFPVSPDCLRPNKMWVIAATQREKAFFKRNQKLTIRYNQNTKTMPVLDVGQCVLIQESDQNKRWLRYGVIVSQDDRKYTIRVRGSGRVITRNRRFLKPVDIHDDDDNDESMLTSQPQVPETPQVSETPQISEVPQVPEAPQVSETLQTSPSRTLQRQPHHRTPKMLRNLRGFNKPGRSEMT